MPFYEKYMYLVKKYSVPPQIILYCDIETANAKLLKIYKIIE